MKQNKARTNENGKHPKKPLLALSFFTGAMGLDLGLEKAGISTVLASEIDEATCKTIAANRPEIKLIGDLRDYSPQEIRESANLGPKSRPIAPVKKLNAKR